MSQNTVTVVAMIKAKPGMEETVKAELLSLIEPTRSEAGCITYVCHQLTDDPSRFMFYENWRSKEDLDKHLQTPYLQGLVAKAEEMFAEPLDVSLWQIIA